MKLRIDRRKLARMWDWALVAAGGVAAYLVTAMPALAPEMGKAGPWITVAIGVLNVVLNKLPKLPTE